jgi:hypothetical protein
MYTCSTPSKKKRKKTMDRALPRRSRASSSKTSSSPTVAADHHIHGFTATIPIPMALSFLACAAAWWIFSQLQIASTEQAVLGLLRSGVMVSPSMTVPQVRAMIDGDLQRDMVIATAIGWAVQLQILVFSFPVHRVLLAAHQRDTLPVSASINRTAVTMAKVQKFLAMALIGADVLTDMMFVLADRKIGTNTIFGIVPLPSADGWGILIISAVYPMAICSVTVFFGIQAAHRLTALWKSLFPPKQQEEAL